MAKTPGPGASVLSAYRKKVPTFKGQSTYSTDFQNILTKAAQSDSIQIDQLQQQQNTDQKPAHCPATDRN